MHPAPEIRVTAANDRPVRDGGRYVLYWMIAQRRARHNFALQHAAWHARELGVGLIVLEALRVGYRWASDRLHRFVIDGMADNLRDFERAAVAYHPYVEPEAGHGVGLLEALAAGACVVVTDEYPCFFLPRMVTAAAAKLDVRVERVDGNGVLPLRAADREYTRAYLFRKHVHGALMEHLPEAPQEDPLDGLALPRVAVPERIAERWPAASKELLTGSPAALSALPIDHGVGVVAYKGGAREAERVARRFVERRLARYDDDRNEPGAEATSGLSPYLHFGHVSTHEVVRAVLDHEGWDPSRLAPECRGKREGFWGVGAPAESFLDELLTWRELGYGFCFHRPDDYDRYQALPDWALETLEDHVLDERPAIYDVETLARGETYDPIWNATQMQLVHEGRIHNYLRMLWGKRVLEWTETPEQAAQVLVELNDRYAVDGRDPNSYSGIFWIFGRFDRAWGPERPIYGKVRYMSSANTRRKLDVDGYVARWDPGNFR